MFKSESKKKAVTVSRKYLSDDDKRTFESRVRNRPKIDKTRIKKTITPLFGTNKKKGKEIRTKIEISLLM